MGAPRNIKRLLQPKSVAVIGASATKGAVGNSVLRNLLKQGYKGKIYAINPNRNSVLGISCKKSIEDCPAVDLAIICTPASTVPAIVLQCGKAKVGGLVIITAGFKEAGAEGQQLWQQLEAAQKKTNVPIIGPNCLGFITPSLGLNATFADLMPMQGKIAVISQSGALATALLDWSAKNSVGFSHLITIGSMIDVGFTDLLGFLADDPRTESIMLYMESLDDPMRFLEIARKVTKKKPVFVIKVGGSAEGAHAAQSHTGSLAGNDKVFDVAFRQAGVTRIQSIQELLNLTAFLSQQHPNVGKRIAIVTNAGGPGVVATDYLISQGGTLAELAPSTIAALDKCLPPFWSTHNPVDIIGDAPPERYEKALRILAADDNVDALLVLLTPQAMTNPESAAKRIAAVKTGGKMIACAFLGGAEVGKGRALLAQKKIPCFETPEEALHCMIILANRKQAEAPYASAKRRIPLKVNQPAAERVLKQAIKERRSELTEHECQQVLAAYGLRSAPSKVVASVSHVGLAAQHLGFPVVLKVLSPDILHKSDVGGVITGIQTAQEARDAYKKIMASVATHAPSARIQGILAEHQISIDQELLIGTIKDPLFGNAIVFGRGGIGVELFKDTAMALSPIDHDGARRLIQQTKIGTLLSGYRGTTATDLSGVRDALVRVSRLVADFPIIKSMDINPLALSMQPGEQSPQLCVLDAKMLLDLPLLPSKRCKNSVGKRNYR